MAAYEARVGVADGVGGEPAGEAGFEASVEEEEKGEADEGLRVQRGCKVVRVWEFCALRGHSIPDLQVREIGGTWSCAGPAEAAAQAGGEEGGGDVEEEVAEAEAGFEGGDDQAGEYGSEGEEEVERGKSGTGLVGIAAASEDVGRGDDLAETDARDEEGERAGCKAGGEAESAEAEAGEDASGEDAPAELAGYGDASDEGAEKLGEEEWAGLLVGEVPAERDGRKDGAEEDGAETGEKDSEGEPGDGWAGGGVVVVGECWQGLRVVTSLVMLPRG